MNIKKVVVIGSGTMGSGIAAHLCNANIPVTLLDLKTEISEQARERIHKSKPPLLLDRSKIDNIEVGNIVDDLAPDSNQGEALRGLTVDLQAFNSEVWSTKKENGISLNQPISGVNIPGNLQGFNEVFSRMHKLE